MIKFHAVGHEDTVHLFRDAAPALAEGESPQDFEGRLAEWTARQDVTITIKLVDRATCRRWNYTLDRIRAENRARAFELRGRISAAADPQLHAPGYETPEYLEELLALMQNVARATVRALSGVEVDGVEPAAYSDPESLPDILEHTGLLGSAFLASLEHQSPRKTDVFYSGS